jgi:phosphoesterase RecJ-like protein
MLTGLVLDQGLKIDAQAAQALYTGIVTDTGQFRFASTSRRTFLLAAELMACGANPPQVGLELYERESVNKLELLQRYLKSLRMECNGRVCIGILAPGAFEETGTTAEDTEGLVDYARAVDGVSVGVLIEERNDGSVKASLRAKNAAYRLDQIAAQFNGGGHASAAGLNLKQGAENFYPRLVAALAKQITLVDGPGKAVT